MATPDMSAAERAPADDTILEVSNLTVAFGPAAVLKDVSFRVQRGTSVVLIGPNGAGKTVLFKALIGAMPFEGTVRWAPGIRFGYVPQKLDLVRDVPITGIDFMRAKSGIGRASDAQMTEALASVGLTTAASRQPIGALSGGQFQRLLVAFALMGNPDVLLLDEPTAGVDEPGQERLNDLIHRFQKDRGLTVFLISHDLSVVHQHATNVLCLGPGRVCFGPPRTVLTPDLLHDLYGSPVVFHVHAH